MVDLARAYRRWLLRRLAILLPLLAASLGAAVWIVREAGNAGWLAAVSLVLAAICLFALGYLLVQTLSCAALHSRGERRRARALREQISSHGRLAALCLLVLAAVATAPVFLLPAPPSEKTAARPLRRAVRPQPPPLPTDVLPEPAAVLPLPPAAPPPAPPPQGVPVKADVPPRLEIVERDFELPLAFTLPFDGAASTTPDSELPRFQPELRSPESLLPNLASDRALNRPGQPDEGDPLSPPPSARIEFLLLTLEGHGRGSASRLEIDLPVGPEGSLHAEAFGVLFGRGREIDELDTQWAWTRLSLGYSHRLLGHTRHAVFDLRLGAGLALDQISTDEAGDGISEHGRFSPYLSLDVGIWQAPNLGLLLHAGRSLGMNLSGAASAVSELAAVVQLDLLEGFSVFGGYRLLVLELRDYAEPLSHEGNRETFGDEIAGPLVGMELRF